MMWGWSMRLRMKISRGMVPSWRSRSQEVTGMRSLYMNLTAMGLESEMRVPEQTKDVAPWPSSVESL